ncbi:hypothetical protein N7492_006232 [Penicillium capsulatum]|uniref:Aminoglycoside phosphotransferase domain-containing protein n=1 Tax=Penicillium capsulatum TaxID=69766 RepID=A0A9W9I147_9EURO|nr:hypothetical protein N7492_006232 [Penicillium capsulatum]KAJ6108884.1 hypothetical protein N7512_008721 [Penicillium capsulatum]
MIANFTKLTALLKEKGAMSPTAIQKAEEEAFTQVNSLLLKDLNTRVKACPSRDMTDLLEHKAKTYPGLWKTFPEASMQSTAENFHHSDATSVVDERAKFLVPINAAIVQLLSATVIKEALEGSDEGLSAIIEGLNKFVTMSEVIWHLGSTAVLGLTPALVMKVARIARSDPGYTGHSSAARHQARLLAHVARTGEPLDSKWKFLSENEKASLKEQLDAIVGDFRFLPALVTHEPQAVLGGGSPRRCKDARRQFRIAPGPIGSETELNEFLTSHPQQTQSSTIAMIRSYLEDSQHQLVLAHGDFHPRNIIVATSRLHDSVPLHKPHHTTNDIVTQYNTPVTITAILDWEMCG